MSATWTPLDRNTHALRLAGARLTWYRLAGDVRSLTIQRAVVDRLLDERLTITRKPDRLRGLGMPTTGPSWVLR